MEPYQILRNAIAQIVAEDAGQYLIAGQPVPAIMVIPPEPKAKWKPRGLEVIIKREPITKDFGMHSGAKRTFLWEVILNQWDKNNYDSLTQVRDRILAEFVGLSSHTYQPQTDLYYERCNILIQLQKYIKR